MPEALEVIAGEVARMVARGWAVLAPALRTWTFELFEGILGVRCRYIAMEVSRDDRAEDRRSVVRLAIPLFSLDCDQVGSPNGSNLAGVFFWCQEGVRRSWWMDERNPISIFVVRESQLRK